MCMWVEMDILWGRFRLIITRQKISSLSSNWRGSGKCVCTNTVSETERENVFIT